MLLECIIVVAMDRSSSLEIFQHELAHCNGWVHADQAHVGRPKKGYVSPKPPVQYIVPFKGKLTVHEVSTKEAIEICQSYGCQWFVKRRNGK